MWRETDDDALMAAVGEGDQAAFNRLVQRHAPRLHAVARRYGCASADAEEIVQDTFLRVWKTAPRWQRGEVKFTTWLYRVTVNRVIDHRRVAGRRQQVADEEVPDIADDDASAEAKLESRQHLAAIEHAITELPDRQRMAVILSVQQEKTNVEIAAILETSEGAVEQLLVRARKTLRDHYRRL